MTHLQNNFFFFGGGSTWKEISSLELEIDRLWTNYEIHVNKFTAIMQHLLLIIGQFISLQKKFQKDMKHLQMCDFASF